MRMRTEYGEFQGGRLAGRKKLTLLTTLSIHSFHSDKYQHMILYLLGVPVLQVLGLQVLRLQTFGSARLRPNTQLAGHRNTSLQPLLTVWQQVWWQQVWSWPACISLMNSSDLQWICQPEARKKFSCALPL